MSSDVEFSGIRDWEGCEKELLHSALNLPGLTSHQALIVEYTWLSMAIIVVLLAIAIISLKTVPGTLQNIFEMVVTFIEGYITEIVGKKGPKRPFLRSFSWPTISGSFPDSCLPRQVLIPRPAWRSSCSCFTNIWAFHKRA